LTGASPSAIVVSPLRALGTFSTGWSSARCRPGWAGAALETDWRSAAEAVLAARVQAAAEKGGESGEETEDEVSARLAWFGLSLRGVDNRQTLFWIGP
jgi:hypothetical protein